MDQGAIPDDWKTANVVPIFKKGDRNRPETYRPVSLTSIACKTLEHILCSSIHRHLEAHCILTDAQHGFRKRRSCETPLIITIQDLAKTVDNKGQTDVILLDFSKAFDKVPHHRLLHKLDFYGIRGSLHSLISSFLGNRSQQVLLDRVTSSSAPVQSRVPQGSVLGPLLFLLFINDLPEYISPKSTARLFADDCILYKTIETESDARDLQLDLDRLQQWEKDWLMEVHPQKCQALHITSKRKPIKFLYNIHSQTLEEAKTAKYLGVTIQNDLNWNKHIDATTKKANNTRAFLQRNIKQCQGKTRGFVTRPWYGQSWNMPVSFGTCSLMTTYGNWRWCSVEQLAWSSQITDLPAASQLCCNNSSGPPSRSAEPRQRCTWCIELSTALWISNQATWHQHYPYARTFNYQRSFFPDTIRMWNSLPQTEVRCSTLDSFREEVQPLRLR